MGKRMMTKDDWNNTIVLINRGIEQCVDELMEFDPPIPDLIDDEDDRNYVLDRLADIRSGKQALRWIERRVFIDKDWI